VTSAILIERVAAVVADGALKSFVILAVAGLVVTLWRKSSASSRHLVWTAGIIASIALPLLGALLPHWRASAVAVVLPIAVPADAVEASPIIAVEPAPGAAPAPQLKAASIQQPPAEVMPVATPAVINDSPASLPARSISPLTLAVVAWISGAMLVLLPFAVGRIRLRRVAKSARLMTDGRWYAFLAASRPDRFARRVTLLESSDAAMPMTWGILSPVLLLPAATSAWPDWKCRNILLHELAHIERFDCLTQFVSRVACALYWFNPLVWVAAHKMQVEREMACDDRVISNGSRASDYAGQLLDVARSLRPARATAHAAIAMARPSQLSGRLTAVLDAHRNRTDVSGKLRFAVFATTFAVVVPIASFSPWIASAVAAAPSESTAAPTAGISDATTVAHSDVAQTLPPVEVTEKFVDGVAKLSGTLMELKGSFTALAGAMPIIKALQSSDAVLGIAPASTATIQSRQSCWEERNEKSSHVSINSDDSGRGRTNVKFADGDCSLELRADGEFKLRPDLSDIESVERGGYVIVEERDGRFNRRLEVRSAASGLERIYYENGHRAEWNNESRAWLATTLMAVERRTAFAAQTRVPQIFAARGARGVMEEVSLMPSDYAKAAYLGVMLKQNQLDAGTLTRLVQQVTREMHSDYYLAEVFNRTGTQRQADENTWRAFADAAAAMKSDYYKAEVIGKVLARDQLDQQTIATLLKATSTINSDYYQAEALKKLSKRSAITAQTRPIYVAALSKISSDLYRAEVLSYLSTGEPFDAATTSAVLRAISDMKSDYYKSQALNSLMKHALFDASSRADFFAAVKSVNSDYYIQQTLSAALDERPLSRETVAAVLAVAPSVKSDHYLSEILKELVQKYPIDSALRPAYDRAVDAIKSNYYRGSVLAAERRTTSSR
jgi:beta-lactamase regulating signal transducer with metallopeptidase domain